MKKIFLFLTLYAALNAYNYNPYISKIANYFNIEPKIIKTLSIIESNNNPNAINVNIRNNKSYNRLIVFLAKNKIDFNSTHNKMVSFSVKKQNYIQVLKFLDKYHYSFDIGYMQINNSHTKTLFMQKLLINNPVYNIYIGSKILRDCFDRSHYDAYKTLSCYNTGSVYKIRKPYIKRFFMAFNKKMFKK